MRGSGVRAGGARLLPRLRGRNPWNVVAELALRLRQVAVDDEATNEPTLNVSAADRASHRSVALTMMQKTMGASRRQAKKYARSQSSTK